MTHEQEQAFRASTNNADPNLLNLLFIGTLVAVLFLWAAFAFVTVYRGWEAGNVGKDRPVVCHSRRRPVGGQPVFICKLMRRNNMNALFLRARKTVCTALVLGLSSPALADLPTVEGPKSKTDGTFYGKIAGYINDGLVLGGLVVAAVAFIVVAMSCVSTFAEVRDGKATWGKFGAMVAVGVVLIVAVIWLANEAATIVAG